MQLDPKTIKKHFQKSIHKYSENALVQKIMAEKLAAQIVPPQQADVLEIGAGAGLLTERLAKINYKNYFANDLVAQSELYVKKYVPQAKFFCGDFRRIKFRQKFDLIASNAVFQWFDDFEKTIQVCKNYLNNDGILAFSTFSPENFKEFRAVSGLTLDYKSAGEITEILKKDFEILHIENFEYKMNFNNPLEILAHMKNTGVNSLSPNKWGVKEVKEFCEKYRMLYPDLSLTYSPIIVIAKLFSYN